MKNNHAQNFKLFSHTSPRFPNHVAGWFSTLYNLLSKKFNIELLFAVHAKNYPLHVICEHIPATFFKLMPYYEWFRWSVVLAQIVSKKKKKSQLIVKSHSKLPLDNQFLKQLQQLKIQSIILIYFIQIKYSKSEKFLFIFNQKYCWQWNLNIKKRYDL